MNIVSTVTEPLVVYECQGSAAILTLNRPNKLNALSNDVIAALMRLLDQVEVDGAVRSVILTGKGDKAFSAGADIAGFADPVARGSEAALREFVGMGQKLTSRIEAFPKPVIAAVNGLAYGGGCEIVEATHITIAAHHAKFAKPEINLGITPTFGGTQRLPRLVGRKRALKMILTGVSITAEEAKDIGLINEVVDVENLMLAALDVAETLASKAPMAITACLDAVTRGVNMSIHEGLWAEGAAFARLVGTRDTQEGIAAFIEKRQAVFTGG